MSAAAERLRAATERLSPGLWTDPHRARHRQVLVAASLTGAAIGVMWLMFSLGGNGAAKPVSKGTPSSDPANVTNLGVMAPGEPVSPVDQWVGNAGKKLAKYEDDKQEQERINRDAKAFEASTMKRFAELEQRLVLNNLAQPSPGAGPVQQLPIDTATATTTASFPPEAGLPPPPAASPNFGGQLRGQSGGHPGGQQGVATGVWPGVPTQAGQWGAGQLPSSGAPATDLVDPGAVQMTRVSLPAAASAGAGAGQAGLLPPAIALTAGHGAAGSPHAPDGTGATSPAGAGLKGALNGFLPVSFTRGILLGGLDAPTGGQAQSNPHPVLIRLSDTSVLPNQYRADYKECFVVASGFGDISAERAYMRTGLLSCVRNDGQALEVETEGNVYGEDGKYGLRGRLVSKQGQMLANALLAGVVSGIGQGFSNANTTYSTSALGSIATSSGSQAYRAGGGAGVGKALDRLAQYYIKLAEQTFPVIEVDAGREVDVVFTRGVRMDAGAGTASAARVGSGTAPYANASDVADRYLKGQDDEDY